MAEYTRNISTKKLHQNSMLINAR